MLPTTRVRAAVAAVKAVSTSNVKTSGALHEETGDGVVSGVVREVVVGEDGGDAAFCGSEAGDAAEDATTYIVGGEGGAPDLGLGLRGRARQGNRERRGKNQKQCRRQARKSASPGAWRTAGWAGAVPPWKS